MSLALGFSRCYLESIVVAQPLHLGPQVFRPRWTFFYSQGISEGPFLLHALVGSAKGGVTQ
jgi:hypothetical protein